jgi:hypothetical protein
MYLILPVLAVARANTAAQRGQAAGNSKSCFAHRQQTVVCRERLVSKQLDANQMLPGSFAKAAAGAAHQYKQQQTTQVAQHASQTAHASTTYAAQNSRKVTCQTEAQQPSCVKQQKH